MKNITSLFLLVTLIGGCATNYQQQGFTGGFSETQLRQDIYRVTFKGNAYTGSERAADYTLLRCAELTKESGYQYFKVIDESQDISTSTYTTPQTTNTTANVYGSSNYATANATSTTTGGQTYTYRKPKSSNTILMLHGDNEVGGITYQVDFIINSMRTKYKLDKIKD
jgi:hypothetical protein